MTQIEFTVTPAKNRVEALEKFGAISQAMSIGHALALSRALNQTWDPGQREAALADARKILEAQMQLAQIELFIHNLPVDP